ncbi:hypothetical protein FACS189485_01850 [Spirochaetia bacterium]|nr:hypothetical protein FACS189485_01850 [Spirochaetia bacterium]
MMNPISAFLGRSKVRKQQQEKIAALETQVQRLSANASGFNGPRTTRFYGQKFFNSLSSPNPNYLIDHATSRHQIRKTAAESTYAAALINRDIDSVIDSGLVLDAEPQADLLGLTSEQSQQWAQNVNNLFDLYAQSKKCSRSETMNLYQAQRLMERCMIRDGEVFVHYSFSNRADLLNPLQFTILDAEQIRGEGYTSTAGMQPFNTMDGIERNEDGKEVGIRIYYRDLKTGEEIFKTIPVQGDKSGRVFISHGFDPEYPGQTRGFSPLTVAINDLENITDLSLSEIEKAKNQSSVSFTLKNTSGQPGEDPFLTDIVGAAPRPPEHLTGNSTPAAGTENTAEESAEPLYTEIPETTFRKPGSVGVFGVPSGQELIPFSSTAPGTNYGEFIKNYFAPVAASVGQSGETAMMIFGSSYSASRATLILTYRIASQRRFNLASHVLDQLYENWLAEEVARGTISAPGFENPVIRAAWLKHKWNGPSLSAIDPLKEAAAEKAYRDMGLETGESLAMAHNASSFLSNVQKLSKEMPLLNAAIGNQAPTIVGKENNDE